MSDDEQAPPEADIPPGYEALDWRRGFVGQVGPLYRRSGPDGASMGFRVLPHHANGMLNAHGGMLMTFADLSWGHVVAVETSSYWVTVRLMCDFLSSARVGDWVEGGGELLSRADDLFVVRGRVWCGERLLMTGTGIFKPIQPREPRPGEKAFTPRS
ncbi:MAG: PaaI family thioesterase [Hyphomonadaceae bacterium]|nr:PaaI family thioesterase [Hyphomonadaceae bacterium]